MARKNLPAEVLRKGTAETSNKVNDSLKNKERSRALEKVTIDPSLMLLSITNPARFESESYILSQSISPRLTLSKELQSEPDSLLGSSKVLKEDPKLKTQKTKFEMDEFAQDSLYEAESRSSERTYSIDENYDKKVTTNLPSVEAAKRRLSLAFLEDNEGGTQIKRNNTVFYNHLRDLKKQGVATRDNTRQIRQDADQLKHIQSDRYNTSTRDADIMSEAQWQKMQLGFIGNKEKVLKIVQSAREVSHARKKKKHGIAQRDQEFREICNVSVTQIHDDFNELLRHIQRFNIKMEQRGALMKMLEIEFQSRHQKVMEEARVYIKKVTELIKKQQEAEGDDRKR